MDTYVHMAAGAALGALLTRAFKPPRPEPCRPANQPPARSAPTARRGPALKSIVLPPAYLAAGILSHAVMDALPHGDYLTHQGLLIPNALWPVREFLACLVTLGVIAGLTRHNPRAARLLVMTCAVGAALPDLESLLIGIGILDKRAAWLPTHNGAFPHGQELPWISALLELGLAPAAMIVLWRAGRWWQSTAVQDPQVGAPPRPAPLAMSGTGPLSRPALRGANEAQPDTRQEAKELLGQGRPGAREGWSASRRTEE